MTISKDLKKLFVAGAALLMVASTGVGMNNVNAKRRYRYHYRTHRVYRRHARRHYRVRRRARRHARRRTYRARRYRSRVRLAGMSARRNMFSYFAPSEIAHLAKLNGDEPVKEFESDCIGDNNNQTYGPAKVYNIDGSYTILNNTGVHYLAKINHMSVSHLIKNDVKHATKWWHWDGTPTKLNEEMSDKYAIKDLNKERAAKGVGPVTQDPVLQFIAEKRAKQLATEPCWPGDPHLSANGQIQTDVIAKKYHLPYTTASENVGNSEIGTYDMPKQSAKDEQLQWDPTHRAARDNPAYTRAGIDGGVEEFSGND